MVLESVGKSNESFVQTIDLKESWNGLRKASLQMPRLGEEPHSRKPFDEGEIKQEWSKIMIKNASKNQMVHVQLARSDSDDPGATTLVLD